jgi:hypothetical protein
VARGESRVTEEVDAQKGRKMTLAVFVTAVTPSDSPLASHLPQEEGFVLRRFALEGSTPGRCKLIRINPKRNRYIRHRSMPFKRAAGYRPGCDSGIFAS